MKNIIFIFILAANTCYCQRKQAPNEYLNEFLSQIEKEDSLSNTLINQSLSSIVIDTLPIYAQDESNASRYQKIATFFLDTSQDVKKIFLQQGRAGWYCFYLDHSSLKKVLYLADFQTPYRVYSFSKEENEIPLEQIDNQASKKPFEKERWESLKIGKGLLVRYNSKY